MATPLYIALATLLALTNPSEPTRLDAELEPLRAKYGLPALAAAVVKDGVIVASGAVGVRMLGTQIPVEIGDRFHLGSDTKAMTATIAGMLVEEGKLKWTSTVGEVLGGDLPGLKPKLAAATLEQLLSHTSGLPKDDNELIALYYSSEAYGYTPSQYRLRIIAAWDKNNEPKVSDGSTFEYANFGYLIAGAMIEKAAGQPWEQLITERVFAPLKLGSAGLGPQATFGKIDAPVGHRVDAATGQVMPIPWGPGADAPAVVGPAGLAHMSILDFATWAGWNAGEGKRGPALVKPETLRHIHSYHVKTPIDPKGTYAFGWGVGKYDWTPDPVLSHNGSNSLNLASILVDTANDQAIVAATNIPGDKAEVALEEVVKALYGKYCSSAPKQP